MKKLEESPQSARKPYAPPRLQRLGSVAQLTKDRLMSGDMDGGANNTRTG